MVNEFEGRTIIGFEKDDATNICTVHFYGYGYHVERAIDKKKDYRFVEYTWFRAPLSEVKKYGFAEYESENGCLFKQYITDCTEAEMLDFYNSYDDGVRPIMIREADINENTPEGIYIVLGGK